MADWIDSPIADTVARLDEVSLAERQAILAGPKDAVSYTHLTLPTTERV